MKKLLLISVLLASSPAFALKGYYNLSRSIRALGMGGAFYGLSDDEYALFYNPAGLSVYRGDGQFMVSFNGQLSTNLPSVIKAVTEIKKADELATKLNQFQGSPIHGGVTPFFPHYIRKHFGIGLLVGDTKLDMALLGRDLDTSIDITGISDSGLFVGYAHDFMDETLHVGINAKAVARAGGRKTFSVLEIAQDSDFDIDPEQLGGAGGAIDFDLGGTYELPDLPFGVVNRASLVINNVLGSPMSIGKTGANPPGLPRTLSLGWYTAFKGWEIFENFHTLIDFAEFPMGGETNQDFGAPGGSFWKHVNFGVEAPMTGGWFIPRLGFMQGYLTAGFGLNIRAIKLDFATYASELASAPGRLGSRRIALRLQIGWGSAPPPPVVYNARNKPKEVPLDTKTEEKKEEKKDDAPPAAKLEEKPKEEPKAEEKRKPQGEVEGEGEPGEATVPATEEAPAEVPRNLDAEEVPKVEGTPEDRFGLEKPTEGAP